MPLSIKNPETEALARAVAERTGESLTEAITTALRERLDGLSRESDRAQLAAEIAELQAFVRSVPDLDERDADAILGYDALGLPR